MNKSLLIYFIIGNIIVDVKAYIFLGFICWRPRRVDKDLLHALTSLVAFGIRMSLRMVVVEEKKHKFYVENLLNDRRLYSCGPWASIIMNHHGGLA